MSAAEPDRGWQRRVSKALAVALRHHPERYGISVDEHGWADLDSLLAALRGRGGAFADVDRDAVLALVAASDKPRYEVVGERIRARYGHSLPVVVDTEPTAPPDRLYHGTNAAALARIQAEGLRPMGRRYVHLSADVATARAVGARRRHAAPVVLVVAALAAHRSGVLFHRAAEGVWLSGPVPPAHLTREHGAG